MPEGLREVEEYTEITERINGGKIFSVEVFLSSMTKQDFREWVLMKFKQYYTAPEILIIGYKAVLTSEENGTVTILECV